MSDQKYRGTGVALVTPFLADRSIDFTSLEKLVNHTIDDGVDFLVALGTTAETPTLSIVEKIAVLEYIAQVNDKRVPLVCGLGGNNTALVLKDLAEFPLEKVDGILCVVPYYNKPNTEGVYQHFKAVAEATNQNIILYNVPGRTGSNMDVDTVVRLANDFKNIVAIKEAAGNMSQSMQLVKRLPASFSILSGDDDLVLPQIAAGFSGVISVAANCWTKDFTNMVNASLDGNFETARELHYKLLDGIGLLFTDGNPPGVKFVLSQMGICENTFRLPVVGVSEETQKKIKNYLDKLS
jgi:4-hydroxy-tetrahydrodipicolinate synthase